MYCPAGFGRGCVMRVINELIVLRVGPDVVPTKPCCLQSAAAGEAGGRSQSRGCPGRPFRGAGAAPARCAVTAFVPKQAGGALAEKPKISSPALH